MPQLGPVPRDRVTPPCCGRGRVTRSFSCRPAGGGDGTSSSTGHTGHRSTAASMVRRRAELPQPRLPGPACPWPPNVRVSPHGPWPSSEGSPWLQWSAGGRARRWGSWRDPFSGIRVPRALGDANWSWSALVFWPYPDTALCRVQDQLRVDADPRFGGSELADELQRPAWRQRPGPPPHEQIVRRAAAAA
jgi:hypothetical protein